MFIFFANKVAKNPKQSISEVSVLKASSRGFRPETSSAYAFRLDYWRYSVVRKIAATPGVIFFVLPSEVWCLLEMFLFSWPLSPSKPRPPLRVSSITLGQTPHTR